MKEEPQKLTSILEVQSQGMWCLPDVQRNVKESGGEVGKMFSCDVSSLVPSQLPSLMQVMTKVATLEGQQLFLLVFQEQGWPTIMMMLLHF